MSSDIYRKQVYELYHRKRNHYWIEANELAHQILPNTLDLVYSYSKRQAIVDEIRKKSFLYKSECESKVIILAGENEKGEKGINVIPYSHRLTKEYSKRLWHKFKKYMKPFQNSREALFLTLTISYRDFGSIGDGAKWSQRQFNSLMTALRTNGLGYYVAVREIQEKNTKNIHYHVLINNEYYENGHIKQRYDLEDLKTLISNNWRYFFKLERVDAELKDSGRPYKKSMIGYLGKYLRKSMQGTDDEPDSDTQIILWALGMRIISCAKNGLDEPNLEDLIYDKTNSNSPSDKWFWRYLGVYSFSLVPLQSGIYKEKDVDVSILEVIYRSKLYGLG